jgi:hypothetical protein
MATEMWAVAAAVLLAVAAGGSAATLVGRRRRWLLLSVAARGSGLLALATALYLAAAGRGGWSPLDLQQVALSLALATVLAHLLLSWAVGSASGSSIAGSSTAGSSTAGNPIADGLAAALAVAAWLAIRPGGETLTCLQRAVAYRAEWALFVSGGGGTLVAGSAALALALPWPWVRAGASGLLRAGSALAVLALGAGIVAGVWWTWQATGSLGAGDIRESWIAVVWLLAAMSTVAWELEWGARRWAAGLALAAAGAALLGLLALPDLQRLMGIQ